MPASSWSSVSYDETKWIGSFYSIKLVLFYLFFLIPQATFLTFLQTFVTGFITCRSDCISLCLGFLFVFRVCPVSPPNTCGFAQITVIFRDSKLRSLS